MKRKSWNAIIFVRLNFPRRWFSPAAVAERNLEPP